MKLTTVGIDLAKNVFQVHGIDQHGKVLLRKQLLHPTGLVRRQPRGKRAVIPS